MLINPSGTNGWDYEYKEKNKKMSMLKFYRQILLRHDWLHYCGALLNEFLVEIYGAIEQERLVYIALNQKKICRRRGV